MTTFYNNNLIDAGNGICEMKIALIKNDVFRSLEVAPEAMIAGMLRFSFKLFLCAYVRSSMYCMDDGASIYADLTSPTPLLS